MTDNPIDAQSKPALSIIFSNLTKASEKQQSPDEAELFSELSKKLWSRTMPGDFSGLSKMIGEDLEVSYPRIQVEAENNGDRGVLRALRWGQKVSLLQKSLIDRFLLKGTSIIEGSEFFVCDACGFIFLGKDVPDLCPVCKAPASRFNKIK